MSNAGGHTRMRRLCWIAGAVLVACCCLLGLWKLPNLVAIGNLNRELAKGPNREILAQKPFVWKPVELVAGASISVAGAHFTWPGAESPRVKVVGATSLLSDSKARVVLSGFDRSRGPSNTAHDSDLMRFERRSLQVQPMSSWGVLKMNRHELRNYTGHVVSKLIHGLSCGLNGVGTLDTEHLVSVIGVAGEDAGWRVSASVASRTSDISLGVVVRAATREEAERAMLALLSSMTFEESEWRTEDQMKTVLARDLAGLEKLPELRPP